MNVETKRIIIICAGCAFLIGVLIGGFVAYKMDIKNKQTEHIINK